MAREAGEDWRDSTKEPRVILGPLHRYIDQAWGSESTWAVNLGRSLARRGISFIAIVGQATPDTIQTLRRTGNPVYELGAGEVRSLTDDLRFYGRLYLKLRKLTRTERSPIIHHVFPIGFGSGFSPYALLRSRSRIVVGPVLYPGDPETEAETSYLNQLQSLQWRRHPFPYPSRILRTLFTETLKGAACILFDSPITREAAIRLECKIADVPYAILPSGGVDSDLFVARNLGSVQRGVQGRVTIGTLTYLRRRKHLDLLLKAMVPLPHSAARLLVGGDGPAYAELRALARRLGMSDRVVFSGRIPRERVPEFLTQMDVYCSLESFPYDALSGVQEAMMSGLPVLAAQTNGSKNRGLQRLPYGLLVDSPVDPTEVSSAIQYFLDHPQVLATMSREARSYAMKRFSFDSIAETLDTVYSRVE